MAKKKKQESTDLVNEMETVEETDTESTEETPEAPTETEQPKGVTISKEAEQTIRNMALIGAGMTVDEARASVLKLGPHPDPALGSMMLNLSSVEAVFNGVVL